VATAAFNADFKLVKLLQQIRATCLNSVSV